MAVAGLRNHQGTGQCRARPRLGRRRSRELDGGVEEVVSAGVDVVAHVPANAELDKALVERMAEAGIVVGPTLATIENTLGEPGGAAVVGDSRLAEVLGDTRARRLTAGAPGGHGRPRP